MSQLGTYNVSVRINFDAGKGKTQTKKMNEGFSNLAKSVSHVGRGFERMGRTISITGFVLGLVARRIIASFQGIAESIMKISKEGTNLDRAFNYLGETLQALALSGMLTDDALSNILSTFQQMLDIALQSAGPWAVIETAIQKLKNAIALGALPSLQELSGFLDDFNLTPFEEALSEATNTFLTPIIDKIKELLGDDESGVTGVKAKLNAIATIGGSFVFGVLEGFNQMAIKAAELVGTDETGIKGISSKLGELSAWALVLAPAGAITGMIVGGFGSILNAISRVIGAVGGPLVVGSLIFGIALLVSDTKELKQAFEDLSETMDLDLGEAFDGFKQTMQIVIDMTTALINSLRSAISLLKELSVHQGPQGAGSGSHGGPTFGAWPPNVGPQGSLGGGFSLDQLTSTIKTPPYLTNNFTINGAQDPARVADEVERRLADKMRRAWMPI